MGNAGKLQTATVGLIMAVGALAVVSLVLFWRISAVNQKMAESQARQYRDYVLTDGLRQTSDDLTRMARLYAATGEERYRDWFQQILDIRNGNAPRPVQYQGIYWDFLLAGEPPPGAAGEPVLLRTLLVRAGFTEGQLALLGSSEANSNALAGLETEAMQAAGEGNLERARSILNGADYHARKADIMRPLAEVLDGIEQTAAAETASYARQRQTLTIALLTALALSILLSAGAVAAFIAARRNP